MTRLHADLMSPLTALSVTVCIMCALQALIQNDLASMLEYSSDLTCTDCTWRLPKLPGTVSTPMNKNGDVALRSEPAALA